MSLRPSLLPSRLALTVALCVAVGTAAPARGQEPVPPQTSTTMMKKLTPLITVDAIEPCLSFWTDRLGFEVVATVPHGDALGFAILVKDGVEIMYQSRASILDDVPAVLESVGTGKTPLFIEVDAIEPLLGPLEGVDIVVPRRTTFYGMDEIFVRAPCGTVVGFAAAVGDGG